MKLLSSAHIRAALPMPHAVAAMRGAFIAISTDSGAVADRQSLPLAGGTGLLMGASADGVGIAAKLVSVMPGNAALGLPGTIGSLMLMDDATGQPLALMDGTALTAWRTAAVSACAIDVLAAADARNALLIGCGTQATTQVLGMDSVRDFDSIAVHASDPGQVAAFIEAHQHQVRARLLPVSNLPETVARSNLIVTATNSSRPVFDAADVKPGCHVNGIGSFRPGMCEIDPALTATATVFIESRLTAETEAGELIAAVEAGLSRVRDWTELGEVLSHAREGRTSTDQVTMFKSVGHALFDLHAARAIYDSARKQELGEDWAG